MPEGVTDDMTDGFDPHCGSCGCVFSVHYYTDEEIDPDKTNRKIHVMDDGIEYSSDGKVAHACDNLVKVGKERKQCPCTGFIEWRDED